MSNLLKKVTKAVFKPVANVFGHWDGSDDSGGGESGGAPEGIDYAAMMAAQADYAEDMANLNFELTQKTIEKNIERYPGVSALARSETKTQATDLNAFMKTAFEGALDELMPSWREDILGAAGTAQEDSIAMTERFKKNVLPAAMDAADEMSMQALSNISSQLRGEIPDDVAAQLKRQAAEVSQQIGVRGQAAQYLTARDLGRTSYDIMQQGLTNAPAALALGSNAYTAFNQALQAPVQTGINVTNLTKAYMAPQVDMQNLFGTNINALQGGTIIPAGTAMQVNASTIANAGQLAQSAIQTSMEYNSQQYWNAQNLTMQNKALDAQKDAAKYQLFGSVLGAGATIGARR